MKKYLTPMDRMRLESARDKDGKLPTVAAYNMLCTSKDYCGQPIVPLGTEGQEAAV